MAQLAPATALPGLVAFAGLAALGHVVSVTGPWTNASAPIAILIDSNGVLEGGADPRRGRFIDGD